MLEKQSNLKAWLYLAPAMILLTIFTFYPLFNAFYLAFLEDLGLGAGGHLVASGYTFFGNFLRVIKDSDFKWAMLNTSVITFISVPVSVMVALLIAVSLNSIKKFQGFLQTVFFLPYVTNAIAIGMVFAIIFNDRYGLFNMFLNLLHIPTPATWIGTGATWWSAMFALLVYTVWLGLAFKIMVFLSGLQSIDKQYYDAARIDATPRKRIFSKITVPLLSPMILYITVTSFIGAFKAYRTIVGLFGTDMVLPGTQTSMITIVGLVYESVYSATTTGALSKAAAGSIILFIIVLLFTLLQMQVSKRRVHF